ncbi:MAG: peptide chain release factor N(5)-glutamine methyltransferase [Ruminococcus sp.]|uniref:peptide chain release factor N(5)-glutamine methyltransferase n=1 Tax=Ruminococcus sp. TaxID=41978 RepID=UPI0028736844|nr:peptide chain release factor N(5)-glutamine methyltransferase [Ruminococcus sp.]MBQ3285261.1 peptide chain release factor N(5)-glutamine methyltransferase [Ruminococcus sp.]
MTVPALRNALKSLLTRADVENPDGDAAEILCAVLNCTRTELILRDNEIPDESTEKAVLMARRRAAGEPIQYVIGQWYFMDRAYKVGEGVLIPRDDTEVVVREALAAAKNIPDPVIIDLCAGSGIIAITLEKELKNATVYAVEKSDLAFSYLQENIELNQAKVEAIHADLADCVNSFDDASLDMIVSNPPYIRSDEIAELQSEVQYEPRLALDGGEDGYDFYEMIIRLWTKKLKEGGCIAFEIGEGQYDRIAEMLKTAEFTDIKGYPDIQGITRAVTAVI